MILVLPLIHSDRDLPGALGRIDHQGDAPFGAEAADLPGRLNGPQDV